MGPITINGVATDVSASPNGATVKWDVEMIIDYEGLVVVLTGTNVETYRSSDQDQISYTASLAVLSEDIAISPLMQQQECSGMLSK